ncbi:MAG: type II toxin-antitoxin system RelE/ParE family toxin [Burkholderiales bacterium]
MEVAEDFDRIISDLLDHRVEDPVSRVQDIVAAIDVLARNPLIGRPVSGDKRELAIGRRSRGYVALYRFVAELDTVFILAIRGQREAGYARG